MADVQQQEAPSRESGEEPAREPSTAERIREHLGGTPWVIAVKLVLLAIVNGLVLFGLPRMIEQRAWTMLAAAVIATIIIDIVYLRRDLLPLKYLVPGTVFLLMFQVYPVIYTFYLSFTNYGAGHILGKQQAIEQIEAQSLFAPEDAVQYQATPFADGDELALLLTDPEGNEFLGTAEGLRPVEEVGEVVRGEGGEPTQVGPFEELPLGEAQERAQDLQELRIPVDEGEIRLQTFTRAIRQEQRLVYQPEDDTLVDQQTGTVYTAQEGQFVSPEGETINPGWRVPIGFDNYTRIFTSPEVRGPFLRVFLWTLAFAVLSVLTTFAAGLLLAMALNKPGMRGTKTYRTLLIVPYALPSFLTALIWAGLMNESFGAINRLFNTSIPWLNDPWMAKASILLVNLWLGFPYMFVVCLGALQAIPGDLLEAARTDGAGGVQAFRRITLPLLFVAVAPLLIASFAFNFNNFNIVFLLTGGGPPIPGAQTPAGNTDILISYTYRLSFEGGRGPEYAFAAAIAVIIFIIVAAMSAYSFKQTRALEELN